MTMYIYHFDLNNFLSYYFCFGTIQMLKNWKNYTKTYLNHTYIGMSIVLAKKVWVCVVLKTKNYEKHTFQPTFLIFLFFLSYVWPISEWISIWIFLYQKLCKFRVTTPHHTHTHTTPFKNRTLEVSA